MQTKLYFIYLCAIPIATHVLCTGIKLLKEASAVLICPGHTTGIRTSKMTTEKPSALDTEVVK